MPNACLMQNCVIENNNDELALNLKYIEYMFHMELNYNCLDSFVACIFGILPKYILYYQPIARAPARTGYSSYKARNINFTIRFTRN